MKPTDEDFMNKVTSDIMVNMGVAMIQQDLPDDTEMLGITPVSYTHLTLPTTPYL